MHALAAAGYAILALRAWLTPAERRGLPASAFENLALVAVLVLHGAALYDDISTQDTLRLSLGTALSATMWLGMLAFVIESFLVRIDGMRLLLLPLAAVAAALPLLLPERHAVPLAQVTGLLPHLLVSLAAYGIMTIAALHALLMAAADRRLHHPHATAPPPEGWRRRWNDLFEALPPLLVLEKVLFHLIRAGFLLLTLAMVTGGAVSLTLSGQLLPFDHKTIFTLLAWVVFGVLLLGRLLRGWRGRVALRYTLTGLVLLMLGYAGTRFILEVILQR